MIGSPSSPTSATPQQTQGQGQGQGQGSPTSTQAPVTNPQTPDLALVKRQGSPMSLLHQQTTPPHHNHQQQHHHLQQAQQQQQAQQHQPGSFPGGKLPPKREGAQASTNSNLQSKSLAALFNSAAKDSRGERAKKPPLRHRNLPPSFFTEPAANFPRIGVGIGSLTSTSGMTLKDLERCGGNPEASEFFELLGPDYSNMLLDQEFFQSGPSPGSLGGGGGRVHQDLSGSMPLPGSGAVGITSGPGLDQVSVPMPYDSSSHYITGGFVYSEPWTVCGEASKKDGGEVVSMRTGGSGDPAALVPVVYNSTDPSSPVGLEDGSTCGLTFPAFFTDCSTPQVPYDGGLTVGGYTRGSYSSL